MPAPGIITTMVVDDELDMRTLLRFTIELSGLGLEVVGEAADGDEALERFFALDPPPTPYVVVLDNRMPKRSGLEVAREILERHPHQLVILFSAHLDDAVRAQAAEIGVVACVSKDDIDQVPGLIRRLADAGCSPN